MRILFMGTPAFAQTALSALHSAAALSGWKMVGVVTQPDRRAGRGRGSVASPVKAFALEQGLPIFQPHTLRLRSGPSADERTLQLEALRMLAPDLIVVAAYGRILPAALLELPTYGCLNLHASLLPAYRGASPVTAALLDGLTETGVSIMLMDQGMDTGPVLAQAPLAIRADDTSESLTRRLAARGAELLVHTIPGWLAGELPPLVQNDLPGTPSVCPLVNKQDGRIDWSLPAARIERMTRAYAPWPTAFTTWSGQNFKVWRGSVVPGCAQPGLVVESGGRIAVGAGEHLLALHEVQPAGKKRMPLSLFRHGAPGFVGSRLGAEADRR